MAVITVVCQYFTLFSPQHNFVRSLIFIHAFEMEIKTEWFRCKLFIHFVLGIRNKIVLTGANFSWKFLAHLIRCLRSRKQLMNPCQICDFLSCSMLSEDYHSGRERMQVLRVSMITLSTSPSCPLLNVPSSMLLTFQPWQQMGEYHVEPRNSHEIQTDIYKENGRTGI